MIKVLRFVDAAVAVPSISPSFEPIAAPLRLTRNTVLESDPTAVPVIAAIDVAWFADLDHLSRFHQASSSDEVVAWSEGQVTTEVALRGEGWLADRWIAGGRRFKHVALARRADGLTPATFVERWQAHAGNAGATPIPEAIRGLAYVQNHPVLVPSGATDDVRFDAVNEVWFDDLETLRDRHRWLTDTLSADRSTDDLFGPRHLLLVEEQVVAIRSS